MDSISKRIIVSLLYNLNLHKYKILKGVSFGPNQLYITYKAIR